MSGKTHPLFNSETVDHPLPSDPREIEAVIVAARACYGIHPYFSMRYGGRGSAFARSDGGYLTTLLHRPQKDVDKQVFWLAGMLSGLGMPRWLMETHLETLYQALSAAVPEKEPDYAKLKHAANLLCEERCSWMHQSEFDKLILFFDSRSQGWIRNAGGLFGAAVCDELSGLDKAVPALMSWMLDSRFSLKWRTAAEETLEKARGLVVRAK